MIKEQLKRLTRELEMDEITPSGDIYRFPINENLSVAIEEIPEGIVFSADLAPCPTKEQERFFADVLFSNLYGEGTFQSVLGLSDDHARLTLTRKINLGASYEEFRDALELFVNAAEFWQEEALEFERQS